MRSEVGCVSQRSKKYNMSKGALGNAPYGEEDE